VVKIKEINIIRLALEVSSRKKITPITKYEKNFMPNIVIIKKFGFFFAISPVAA
jgi:hypothetical protein